MAFMTSVKLHHHVSKVRYSSICPRGAEDNGLLNSTKIIRVYESNVLIVVV